MNLENLKITALYKTLTWIEVYIQMYLEETGLSIEEVTLVEQRNLSTGALEINLVRKEKQNES